MAFILGLAPNAHHWRANELAPKRSPTGSLSPLPRLTLLLLCSATNMIIQPVYFSSRRARNKNGAPLFRALHSRHLNAPLALAANWRRAVWPHTHL